MLRRMLYLRASTLLSVMRHSCSITATTVSYSPSSYLRTRGHEHVFLGRGVGWEGWCRRRGQADAGGNAPDVSVVEAEVWLVRKHARRVREQVGSLRFFTALFQARAEMGKHRMSHKLKVGEADQVT